MQTLPAVVNTSATNDVIFDMYKKLIQISNAFFVIVIWLLRVYLKIHIGITNFYTYYIKLLRAMLQIQGAAISKVGIIYRLD